jgi:formate dehydrogenase subunit gamma
MSFFTAISVPSAVRRRQARRSGFPIGRRDSFIDSIKFFPHFCHCSKKRLGMPRHEPWNAERASEIIARYRHLKGATLPILHALQERFGCVPEAAVPLVAEALNLSRAEVHGTVTFYHDFRKEPAGRRVLKLCRAESCQAAGGDALAARAESLLGVEMGETTADRRVTLEPVYCLGLCHSSPAAILDNHVHGMLDAAKLDALVKEAQS